MMATALGPSGIGHFSQSSTHTSSSPPQLSPVVEMEISRRQHYRTSTPSPSVAASCSNRPISRDSIVHHKSLSHQERTRQETTDTTALSSLASSSSGLDSDRAVESRFRSIPRDSDAVSAQTLLKLPLRLPAPALHIISDPYKDLPAHLRRHGLPNEARTFGEAQVPTDYALHAYITAAVGGPPALLEQTSMLLVQHQTEVERQMAIHNEAGLADPKRGQRLPDSLAFDIESLDPIAEARFLTPTHILAIHPCLPSGGNISSKSRLDSQSGMLLPIHAMVYVLQCVSLPALPSAPPAAASVTTGCREMPVICLKVPSPSQFPVTHRFLYSHDSRELLCSLLPIRWITMMLNQAAPMVDFVSPSLSSPLLHSLPGGFTISQSINTLAKLATSELLQHAQTIHAAWSNGVAIGLISHLYWQTLERAWSILINALRLRQGRERIEDDWTRILLRDMSTTPKGGVD